MNLSQGKKSQKGLSTPMFIGVVVLIGIIVIFIAVMIGKSDNGQIDISDVIENFNRNNVEQGGNPANNIGTTPGNLRSLPNGGLVPQDTALAPESEPIANIEEAEISTSTDDESEPDT